MKIVKISIDYISSPLTHIFNLCISEGIFPQKNEKFHNKTHI